MKVLHTVPNIDEEASGPSYSVPSLVAAVNAIGNDAEVVTVSAKGITSTLGAPVRSFEADEIWPTILRRLGRSRGLESYIAGGSADIIHAHGLWMMPTIYAANRARKSGLPLVLAPRGMLGRDALSFSQPIKRTFGAVYQDRALRSVTCFHATAESELEDIRAFGLTQPVAVIPNGIDLPSLDNARTHTPAANPYILSLGRVHPKKALDRLITAFATNAQKFPQWRLRIVGPSEQGYSAVLRGLAERLGVSGQVSIEQPVFNTAKVELMRSAELFALSTLHENFAMTVAESLAAETPVISTYGAPWAGLTSNGCGWWIDYGEKPIAEALEVAMSLSSAERRLMGRRGRKWMQSDFAWAGIAAKMEQLYSWLLGEGSQPNFVYHSKKR